MMDQQRPPASVQAALAAVDPTWNPPQEKPKRPEPMRFDIDSIIPPRDEEDEPTPHGAAPQYDWPYAMAKYVNTPTLTLKDIAEELGAAEITVRKRAAKEDWSGSRKRKHDEFVRFTTQESLRKQAKAAIGFNASCLDGANKIAKLANARLDQAIESGQQIEERELVNLGQAIAHAQKIGREALGLPTGAKALEAGPLGQVSTEPDDLDQVQADLLRLMGEDTYNAVFKGGK